MGKMSLGPTVASHEAIYAMLSFACVQDPSSGHCTPHIHSQNGGRIYCSYLLGVLIPS